MMLVLVHVLSTGCDDGASPPEVDAGSDATVLPADAAIDSAVDAGPPVWEQVGGQLSPAAAESEDPAMMVVGGQPAVGYRHASFQALLQTWDGSDWSAPVADPTEGQTIASIYRAPDFCSDGTQVYMAYGRAGDSGAQDATFYDRIFLHRWTSADGWSILNGGAELSQWLDAEEVGYNADDPAIACPTGASPVVSWPETDLAADQDVDLFVRAVPGDSSPRINRVTPQITDALVSDVAVASDGTIYLAHFELATDATFDSKLYVTRYQGGNLQNLGGAIDQDRDTNRLSAPSLALDGSTLYLAWSADRDDSGERHIYVARYDGASDWQLLTTAPVAELVGAHVDSANPDLIINDGKPTLACEEVGQAGGYIFVAEFDASDGRWRIIGDRLNVDAAREALDPSLARAADGTLYLAFEEFVDGRPQIFVKRRRAGP